MKIDTAKIEGFDTLTPEQKVEKLLALDMEVPQPDYTGYVKKDVFDKTASELAAFKKEQFEKLSKEEQAKKLAEEEVEKLRTRNAELEKAAAIASYKAKYVAMGYSEENAAATAEAFANGDMDKVFEFQSKFLAEHDKQVKANMLGGTTPPPAGSGKTVTTAEDIWAIEDDDARIEAIANNLALFENS